MSNVNHGLRFDIYERVNLPENVAPIEELEEIELVPRIQVIDQGEYALLQGQLVLNGIYRGQGIEQEQIALEHWIPVEISLPMNRVQQLDEITVDIDTFDVEHLTERSLNITGVLSLRGIVLEDQADEWQPESFSAQQENERFDYEEQQYTQPDEQAAEEQLEEVDQQFTYDSINEVSSEGEASYRDEDAELYEASSYHEQEQLESEQEQQRYVQAEQTDYDETTEDESYVSDASPAIEEEKAQWSASLYEQQAVEAERTESWHFSDDNATFVEDEEQSREPEQAYEEAVLHEQLNQSEAEQANAYQEPQIAISPNKASNESIGIRDILSSSLREQAAHEASRIQAENERLQQEEASRPTGVEDEIAWQQLFLSKRNGQNEFKKIKVYIVQKDDTLDQIAMRYEISAREILAHNKLHESAISEGQLIYIP